jgi:hypothetical protein
MASATLTAKDSPRAWAHKQLDLMFDNAEREQLWGKAEPKMVFQAGQLVKFDLAQELGKKFDLATT